MKGDSGGKGLKQARCQARIGCAVLLSLLLVYGFASIPQAQAVEPNTTLYFRSDASRWGMNSLDGGHLDNTTTSTPDTGEKSYATFAEDDVFHWAMDLKIRHKNNTETTVGLKVCDVNQTILDSEGWRNASYTMTKDYKMLRSDTITARVYGRQNTGTWGLFTVMTITSTIFTTPAIGTLWLNQTTLTTQYYTAMIDWGDGTCLQYFYWGIAGYQSFITGFLFDYGVTTPTEAENMEQYFLLGGSMTFLIGFGIVLTRRKRLLYE